MEIDNQTNDPVDYEQVGSGGGTEEEDCMQTGQVGKQSQETFEPCGLPPYSVRIKDAKTQQPRVDVANVEPNLKVVLHPSEG